MKLINAITLVIFIAALASIAVCFFADWNDELYLSIGLVLSAVGNIINILYTRSKNGEKGEAI